MVELKAAAINVTILLMFLNGVPALLAQSGVAEDIGVQPSISGDENISQANQKMQDELEPVDSGGGTLFTLYNTVTGPIRAVLGIVTAGPTMLMSAGVPGWLVGFVFIPQYLIVGATILYVLAGRLL